MAAATVTGSRQNNVAGNRRQITATSVAFAANGDTWDTGLAFVETIMLTPTTNTAFGFTVGTGANAGIITLVSGGALTFRGSVQGY